MLVFVVVGIVQGSDVIYDQGTFVGPTCVINLDINGKQS